MIKAKSRVTPKLNLHFVMELVAEAVVYIEKSREKVHNRMQALRDARELENTEHMQALIAQDMWIVWFYALLY